MKLLKSKRGIPIPKLFFITDKKQIQDIPKGTPYFLGDPNTEEYILEILEFEVLYQKAVSTGYPFDYERILKDKGYKRVDEYNCPDIGTNVGDHMYTKNMKELRQNVTEFKSYISDGSIYVDINVIKSLNVFPTWMDDLEKAVSTNIHNFATYDTNMYNKKLEGMYGGLTLSSPNKNLIIIDISNSIPRQIGAVCLALAKNLSANFYADIMITGRRTSLFEYDNIDSLNIEHVYETHGRSNEQNDFKTLITTTERSYDTLISFGDDDSPGQTWDHQDDIWRSDEQGQEINKWSVKKIISFHAYERYDHHRGRTPITAFARWFKCNEKVKMTDWVKYLK